MTDVSKAIYSGDWELYPKDGKVTIQDFEHCKIVLTEADADEVCELLIERKRRKASKMNVLDLNVDEKVFSTDFINMPKLAKANLMIEALINAGYRMVVTQTAENRDKWRALVNRWRGSWNELDC